MPDDLGDLASQTDHRNYWGAAPPSGGLADLAGQQQMTHQPQQPNPAAPYIDAVHQAAQTGTKFMHGGLTEAFPAVRQAMPDWLNSLGSLVQSQSARDAFSTANPGGIPLGGMFVGARGLLGDQAFHDLELARQMEAQGFDRSQIMDVSKWFREKPSDIWNKEIFDKTSTLNEHEIPSDPNYFVRETTVGNILNHDDLYQAYPHLRDLPLTFSNSPEALRSGTHGSFLWPTHADPYGRIRLNNPHIKLNSETKSILLHELQHAIDSYEGRKMRSGSSWNDYVKLIEEVRARNTEYRSRFSEKALKNMYPWDTQQFMQYPIPEGRSTP